MIADHFNFRINNMARLAKKLEVSVDMLNATLAVLNKI